MTQQADEVPDGATRVRVLIADDHPVYLSGLRGLLETLSSVEVIGEACTGPEVLSMTERLQPDLVLMDVRMPGLNGIEVTKLLSVKYPGIAVVLLTMMDQNAAFFAALRAGARGYLLKGASAEDVERAIVVAQQRGLVLGPVVADWALEHLTRPRESTQVFPQLTDRERSVLEMIADGRGNAAIALRLGLSVKTVRNYVSRIFTKLQIADRTAAAVLARREGLGN